MSVNPVRVLIIGCGNIAGAFDQARLSNDLPLTHAGGFSKDTRFNLAACVEPDDDRRGDFMRAWDVPLGFCSTKELTESGEQFDVISICSPTTCHLSDLEIALSLNPKLIFCEKPLTKSFFDSKKIVTKCGKYNIPLAVNYTRRWDPDISKLQKDIQAGHWGEFRSVNGIYSKGILNNGSHMLDLLHQLIGSLEIVKVGRPVQDYFSDDPSVPVWLEGPQSLPIHLSCSNAGDYSFFELQFVFSLGILTMEEGGLFWRERRAVDSTTFKGYRDLDNGKRRLGGYPNSMIQAVDNIYRVINQNGLLASTGESALVTQGLCEQIKDLANNYV